AGMADLPFNELLGRLRGGVLEGFAHQDYPLPRMLAEHPSIADAGTAPFRTLFVLQDFTRFKELERLMLGSAAARVQFGSLELSPLHIDQQEGQFELSLHVWP